MKRARFSPPGPLALKPMAFGLECLFGEEPNRSFKMNGTTAIVEVLGPLMHHGDSWWWDSYDAIKSRVSDALASDAKAVLLSIDSPGGLMSGAFDTARELRAMAEKAGKPLVGYVDGEAASAACALICACERVFVPATGMLGSIGVIATPMDCTKADQLWGVQYHVVTSGRHKADGNPHVPMTDEALSAIQATVDAQASVFFELVADLRGMNADAVRGLEARVFVGQSAIAAGLADEIATMDQVLAKLASGTTAREGTTDGKTMSDYSDGIASLKKAAEGEGEEAKKAKKALAALEGEPDGDEKKDAKKAEGSEPDGDEKKEDKKDEEAKASRSASAPSAHAGELELAARVQTIESELAAKKEAEERATLIASRPDLAASVVKFLGNQAIQVVREACRAPDAGGLPIGPGRVTSPASAAQSDVRPTMGATEGGGATAAAVISEEQYLAERMGLRTRSVAPTFDGFTQSFPAMTRQQAGEFLASRKGGKAQ